MRAKTPDAPPSRWQRAARRALFLLIVASPIGLGANYVIWRAGYSVNWAAWWIAIPMLAAEWYSYLGAWLFGLTILRIKRRGEPPPVPPGATVDVFITCYNEPVELVRETVRAAVAVTHAHKTYVLDDGDSAPMRAMAEEEGAGYIVRTQDWKGRPRHAKAGNLNNAIMQTDGEFILVLDADQIPFPQILHRTLGYFRDEKVAFVQTPQWFYNMPRRDPFGSEASLFYGPILQGKDGWNATFFCGSNGILRREALMQMGIRHYVKDLERRVPRVLHAAGRLLRQAERRLSKSEGVRLRDPIRRLRAAAQEAQRRLRRGDPIQEVTWGFQREAEAVASLTVAEDLKAIRQELADIPGIEGNDMRAIVAGLEDEAELVSLLSRREWSPLASIEAVRSLLLSLDVSREDEAQPVLPMSTISVTEDMATAMRLHAMGWRSVYHNEILARGMAPEDLRSSLQQRLRWAQGTVQIFLRENPLFIPGLTIGQRLMYLATMWSYLQGFFSVVYLSAPIIYMFTSIAPVRAFDSEFFWHLGPYLIANQLMFTVVAWGKPTWRGQQYYLALFPVWINAVASSVQNVYFGKKLSFVVTPKTRQGGVHPSLVRWQLFYFAATAAAVIYGCVIIATGRADNAVAIIINIAWSCYNLVLLSVVFEALYYKPPKEGQTMAIVPAQATREIRGRAGAGSR